MKRKLTSLPKTSNESARREQKRFLEDYKKFMDGANEISLTVLVWGTNPNSTSPIAKKRKDIRKALVKLGHNAVFSESIPSKMFTLASEKSKEFAQAQAADLIIILIEDSPGALAEAHDFCEHPDLVNKLFVMCPIKYRKGYSGKGAIKDLEDAYGAVHWYKPKEIPECKILERAVNKVQARRNIRYRRGGNRR